MTTSNLIHLSGMIAIQGGLISSGEALAPGESAHRFGDYILLERIAGSNDYDFSKYPRRVATYLITRKPD